VLFRNRLPVHLFIGRCPAVVGLVIAACLVFLTPASANQTPEKDFAAKSAKAVGGLQAFLQKDRPVRGDIADQTFADIPLTRADAAAAEKLLWADHAQMIREDRAEEMKSRVVTQRTLKMPFWYKVFGEKPNEGRRLFISLHGGGGAPARVNDQQWHNQKRLYAPAEGVYLVPRSAVDAWNMWHQPHNDYMFGRLIENLIVFEDVNPDRVYLLGYSAGGDGVYQLAPRMSDRFAAAAMMAGHPNETSPLGLRNIAFTLHVGGKDSAYSRNRIAREWTKKLADLQKNDPGGYVHWAKVYDDKGHWLDREDRAAIPWMAKHARDITPDRIVWRQDDVAHNRFYWLYVDDDMKMPWGDTYAQIDGQTVDVESTKVKRLSIRLRDDMLDLDKPVKVTSGGAEVFSGNVFRTIATLAQTLAERGDPHGLFSAEISVELPELIEVKWKG